MKKKENEIEREKEKKERNATVRSLLLVLVHIDGQRNMSNLEKNIHVQRSIELLISMTRIDQ